MRLGLFANSRFLHRLTGPVVPRYPFQLYFSRVWDKSTQYQTRCYRSSYDINDLSPTRVICILQVWFKILSCASEVGSPTNHLGSRQRRDTGQGSSDLWTQCHWTRFTKAGWAWHVTIRMSKATFHVFVYVLLELLSQLTNCCRLSAPL